MPKINTVLFDLDGTLINTYQLIIESFQHTFRTVLGHEKPVEEIARTFGEPLALTMSKMLTIPPEEAMQIYRGYHYEHFEDLIEIYPGMGELVAELSRQDYRLGVVTSRLRNTTERALRHFQIMDHFDYVLTADDTDKHKPDPTPVLMALDKLGAKPHEAIMIGDTIFDIGSARNAGVTSVMVGWSEAFLHQEEESEFSPDHVIQEASELLELIRRI